MNCYGCGAELVPDNANLDTKYQFDNALWIAFHGGYGMFTDNLMAKLPNNTDARWLRNSNRRGVDDLYDDYALVDGKLVDDPDWQPEFNEDRLLPGHPDYEAVICHECAHALCAAVPWIERLLNPYGSHAHRTAWKDAHPEHWGWDYEH